MKKILITLILILNYLFISQINAQNNSTVNMELSDDSEPISSETRNVIKFNPLLFFRGDIPIYYERSISDKLSIETGVGFTLSDYLNFQYFYDGYQYDEEIGLGYSARIGIRYYASDYSYMQEGFYFGANVRLQSYKSSITSIEGIAFNGNNNFNNLDFRFNVGYLHLWEENFFLEPYMAFGFRNKSFQEIKYDAVNDLYSLSSAKKLAPIFSLGVKIGITF